MVCYDCRLSPTFPISEWEKVVSPEVHVEGEVHELVADFPHVEDVEGDSHLDWWTAVVGSNTSVVTNLAVVYNNIFTRNGKLYT